ncbi:hypothetical protein LCGC14_0601860 [marine sediment metagenome]|uniref:Uncharacterized protein n=1 Tax=marine sediment metagenome TaxID=412755 RepID=A0A0F9RF22_9ZZZZ
MGLYNTYGDNLLAQMKVSDILDLTHFGNQDVADIPDGLYITHEGIVIIQNGRIIHEYVPEEIFDKWGLQVNMVKLLHNLNPLTEVMNETIKKNTT